MKKYVKTSSDSVVTLYHGDKLPGAYELKPIMCMPDLGLHCGSLMQAESHSSTFIIEVKCKLFNIVDVKDQNDWNNPIAVSAILKAAGKNYSSADIVELQREANIEDGPRLWSDKSKFYNKLLVENGISVVRYKNTIDSVQDTCYCIVDGNCIISITPYKTATGIHADVNRLGKEVLPTLPDWVSEHVTSFSVSPSAIGRGLMYDLAVHPLPDDPDQYPKQFWATDFDNLLDQIHKYEQTYKADRAADIRWLSTNF